MALRSTVRLCGATLAAVVCASVTMARPASAQEIERVLAGIRLGSKSGTVLAKFGNPNEVVIGDVNFRSYAQPGAAAGQPGQGGPGGPEGGLPGVSGAPGFPAPGGIGAFGLPNNIPGYGGGGQGGPSGDRGDGGGAAGGFPGAPGGGGVPYGSGAPTDIGGAGASGPFGNTLSTASHEQEVTWIYNRKVANNLLSYQFLIGPNGDVSQIMVTGYAAPGLKTKRNIGLGATYKDVIKTYGYPDEHLQVGRVLVADYRKAYHVSFQFLNHNGQADLLAGGNKVIAITIATVE